MMTLLTKSYSVFNRTSDQIGELPFGFPEIPKAGPDQQDHPDDGGDETRPKNQVLPAQNAPAKTVDDPHHGVHGIKQAPFFADVARHRQYRRGIQAELHDER